MAILLMERDMGRVLWFMMMAGPTRANGSAITNMGKGGRSLGTSQCILEIM